MAKIISLINEKGGVGKTSSANAIAVCVDALYHDDIVGSVAGDDTILLVVADNVAAETLAKEMKDGFVKK